MLELESGGGRPLASYPSCLTTVPLPHAVTRRQSRQKAHLKCEPFAFSSPCGDAP